MSKKKSRLASGLYVFKINFFDLYNSTTIPQLSPEEIKRIVIKKCAISKHYYFAICLAKVIKKFKRKYFFK